MRTIAYLIVFTVQMIQAQKYVQEKQRVRNALDLIGIIEWHAFTLLTSFSLCMDLIRFVLDE